MNELLKKIDGERRKKFQGSFVGNTDWALLLDDMRPHGMFSSQVGIQSMPVEAR